MRNNFFRVDVAIRSVVNIRSRLQHGLHLEESLFQIGKLFIGDGYRIVNELLIAAGGKYDLRAGKRRGLWVFNETFTVPKINRL